MIQKKKLFMALVVFAALFLAGGAGAASREGAVAKASDTQETAATDRTYVGHWKTTAGNTYYIGADGTKVKSRWLKIGGKYYYFNSKGRLVTNKAFSVKGRYYCADKTGARICGKWVTIKRKTYYCTSDGKCVQDSWKKIKGKYYYFNEKGVLQKSRWIGNYYVNSRGVRVTNKTVDGYRLGSDGKRIFTGKYIFVGDCRTVGMSYAVQKSNTLYIGEVSMGLSRFKSVGSAQLASYLSANPNARVILGYGLNDLYQLNSYISYYKALFKQYPKAEFYVMSINPINEAATRASGYSVTTAQIKAFNKSMEEAFPDNYLDTYSYLEKSGFSASDGMHYASSTYVKLYDYIIKKLNE